MSKLSRSEPTQSSISTITSGSARRVRREPIRPSSGSSEVPHNSKTVDISVTPSITDNHDTPETPKRKRTVDFLPLTPESNKKRAFATNLVKDGDFLSPFDSSDSTTVSGTATLHTPPTTPTVYSLGKAIFQRGSGISNVIGRGKERVIIEEFIRSRIEGDGRGGALYLSGLPGTGKSALLGEIIRNLTDKSSIKGGIVPRVANINCMIVDKPELIYARIHRDLTIDHFGIPEDEEKQGDIEDHNQKLIGQNGVDNIISDLDTLFLNRSTRCHIVILDELDHVVTKDQEVLFKIFQWAFMEKSNLILVGIANALDLTDRFLPRLRSNGLTPQLLPFSPYSASEIEQIIETRLRGLTGKFEKNDPVPLMQLSAIQLCAKKTAANTGDLRKAFDICRRAIEVVEEDVRRKYGTTEYDNQSAGDRVNDLPASWKRAIVNGNKSIALTSLTLDDAPRVSVAHIARVCSNAFGGSTTSRIKGLNLQQKAVLCVLVLSERNTATTLNSNLTIVKLFEKYSQICDREKLMGHLHLNEFLEVISALEFSGVVNVSGVCGRKGLGVSHSRRRTSQGGGGASAGVSTLGSREEYSHRRISSNVHLMDLLTAVSEIAILRQFLEKQTY